MLVTLLLLKFLVRNFSACFRNLFRLQETGQPDLKKTCFLKAGFYGKYLKSLIILESFVQCSACIQSFYSLFLQFMNAHFALSRNNCQTTTTE